MDPLCRRMVLSINILRSNASDHYSFSGLPSVVHYRLHLLRWSDINNDAIGKTGPATRLQNSAFGYILISLGARTGQGAMQQLRGPVC